MSRNVFERRKFHEKSGYQSTVYPQCPEASPADPDGRKERRQNYRKGTVRDCRHQPWHLLSPLRQPLCPVGGHRKPVSGGKSRHFPLLLEDPARPEPDDRTLSVHPKE